MKTRVNALMPVLATLSPQRGAGKKEAAVTIVTDPLFYVLAVPAVLALGLAKGGFSGMGQMALPLLALVMPPLEAAAIMLPIMILQDATAVWVYRKDWSGRVLAVVIPGAVIGVDRGRPGGGARLRARRCGSPSASSPWASSSTTGSAPGAWRASGRAPQPVFGVFWGALSGFTSTLAQVGGPPYQIYALAQKMPKMTYVGTNALFFASMNWMKVIPYFALGQFSTKGLGTTLVLVPLAIVANQFGFWLVRRIPQDRFYTLTLWVMFLVSLALIRAGVVGLMR